MKPLKVVKPDPRDPTWRFPYASRQRVDELRQYFAQFATKPKGWRAQPRTHCTHIKDRHPEIPWYQVEEHLRPRVEEWFQRKVAEWKASRRPLTRGKLQSLRMLAVRQGRWIWTGKRAMNALHYKMRKQVWLAFLEWSADQDRRNIEIAKDHTRSKQLEI